MTWHVIDADALADMQLLQGLTSSDLMRVAQLIEVQRFAPNQIIANEGQLSDRIYFVRGGSVRISRTVPGVGEEALATLGVGACFGEMTLFGGTAARSADVIADATTELLTIPLPVLRDALDSDPHLANRFLWGASRLLADRLREANAKVLFLSAAGVFSR